MYDTFTFVNVTNGKVSSFLFRILGNCNKTLNDSTISNHASIWQTY